MIEHQKDYKRLFLEQAMLGVGTNLNDSVAVISRCFDLSYKDMATVGRFYIGKIKEGIFEEFSKLLEVCDYSFSIDLIRQTSHFFADCNLKKDESHYISAFGVSQKLVNMMFKYLYVFSEYTGKNIDFSKCDCPLDSIILKNIGWTGSCWSKMKEAEYIKCQNMINEDLKQHGSILAIGNLEYDFMHWRNNPEKV